MAEIVQFVDHATQLKRDREIFRLRLEGYSAHEIVDEIGCELAEVHAAMHRMSSGVTDEFKARVVETDLARLEALHKIFFKKALKGDVEAANACVRFMDRRAKFCGLDVLPRGDAARDQSHEQSSFDKAYEVIMRLARGPTIDGEVIKDGPAPD